MDRYKQRAADDAIIHLVETNWDEWMDDMESQVGCNHIVLKDGEFLSDVM